jgi:hypothetical protein
VNEPAATQATIPAAAAVVGEARVHHGGALVDAAAGVADDAMDDVQEVRVVAEAGIALAELAAALHEDAVRAHHQDVGDLAVGEERLERPEAEDVVEHATHQLCAHLRRHGLAGLVDELAHACIALRHQLLALHDAGGGEVERGQQSLVQFAADLVQGLVRSAGHGAAASAAACCASACWPIVRDSAARRASSMRRAPI